MTLRNVNLITNRIKLNWFLFRFFSTAILYKFAGKLIESLFLPLKWLFGNQAKGEVTLENFYSLFFKFLK